MTIKTNEQNDKNNSNNNKNKKHKSHTSFKHGQERVLSFPKKKKTRLELRRTRYQEQYSEG